MSTRCCSCSGRRLRLPGEPVIIEKLAVVGEMFPADDTDLFALWLKPRDEGALGMELGEAPFRRANTIVGDPGGDEPFIDIAAKESGETPSSCMIIDMLDGRVAKTDDAPLIRFRLEGTKPSALSIGVSGEANGGSGEEYVDECARVRRSELVRECVRLRCPEEAGLP